MPRSNATEFAAQMVDLRVKYIAWLSEQSGVLEGMRQALDDEAPQDALAMLAHRLVGSGSTFGFSTVSDAATKVEECLIARQSGEDPQSIAELSRWIELLAESCATAVKSAENVEPPMT